MGTKLVNLESVTPEEIAKLESAGLHTTDDILARCALRPARAALAAETAVPEAVLDRLVRTADLMRITGIAEPHTLLLAALDTPRAAELASCEATVLIKQMRRKNVELMMARAMPPESTVARWINDARSLPPGAEL